MSDEVLSISVDDSQIDAALAKLNEALAKKEQLTGQPTPTGNNENVTSPLPTSEAVQPQTSLTQFMPNESADATREVSDFSTFWSRLEDVKQETKTVCDTVDVAVEGSKQKLDGVKVDAVSAKTTADAASSEVGDIKGLETASRRILHMLPGMREADKLRRNLALVTEGNILGVVGLLMLAYTVYNQISQMLDTQQQQQEEYQAAFMQAQNFTSVDQLRALQTTQRHVQEAYRGSIIP